MDNRAGCPKGKGKTPMKWTPHYETDDATFDAEAYTADGWGKGIAWRVYGWETAPDEDTHWSGTENRTGRVVAVMIGDDRRFTFEPDDLTPLNRADYCGECGQVGCCHDGLDRSEDSE
jgi:hypothetical protein